MERLGVQQAIQGGGTGTGFTVPIQMRLESTTAAIICGEITRSAQQSIENRRKILQNDQFTELYEEQGHTHFKLLKRRLAVVMERKKMKGNFSNLSERNKLSICGDTIPRTEKDRFPSVEGNFPRSRKGSTTQRQKAKSQRTIIGTKSVVNNRYVPGLPQTIEQVVQIWSFGVPEQGIVPLRLLNDATNRSKVLVGYTNNLWSNGGQKNAYKRFRTLVFCVSEFASVLFDVYKEHNANDWAEALKGYHETYDLEDKPRPLTSVIKLYRMNKL